jgi:hypothetical protein
VKTGGADKDGGDRCLKASAWSENRALTGGPHRFGYFPKFQKQHELVNSKQMSSIAPKILKCCTEARLEYYKQLYQL